MEFGIILVLVNGRLKGSFNMCIFHKWGKWEQYDLESFGDKNNHLPKSIIRRQRRRCEKCNKEQDRLVSMIY